MLACHSVHTRKDRDNNMKATRYIAVLLSLGVCLCVLGIALIIAASLAFAECEERMAKNCSAKVNERQEDGQCAPSDEAIRVGLYATLDRVISVYFSLNPNNVIWLPGVERDDLRRFRPYNSSPQALKERTDEAWRLHQDVAKLRLRVNESLMKPRELKSLIQLLHYLKTDFGRPYGENYYAGDWMMGPSRFCAESICKIGVDLYYQFNSKSWSWQPQTIDDVEFLLEQLRAHRVLIRQYIRNIKYGIEAGMVRSTEECEAGYYSLSRNFFKVFTLGSKGILKEWFANSMMKEDYLALLEEGVENEWIARDGKSVRDSINVTLVEYLGQPLSDLFKYLKDEHRLYCVPSNVSSGLATLPLDYVYYNGTRTRKKTTKKLPFGEAVDGKRAYESILYYFTTMSDFTADAIHKLGKDMLSTLYPEAIKIAENFTGKSENESIVLFRKMLDNQSSFFNDAPFPANESNDEAFTKCSSLKKAKMYCPKRHEAFKKWSSFVRGVLGMLEPKTINMFYFTGEKRTTPTCPVNVVPNFNPKTGSQSYRSSGPLCPTPCLYRLPFFMDNLGPVYNVYSVAGHEGRPGHHTQIQGNMENFNDDCDDNITWLDEHVTYPSFSEGWGLYAENPLLAKGTDVYDHNLVQKYGMLKWQIWRAIRLVVDTGLHYKGMKRSEALEYHDKYAWDTTDKATKDVTRYQSNPGQATAYMIGQQEIWRLRKLTKQKIEAANKTFSEKDFHYQILSQGNSPLEYLKIHINKYINCVTSHDGNCDSTNEAAGSGSGAQLVNQRKRSRRMLPILRSMREHFD